MIGKDEMATVLCVLYDDPVDGYPKSYARDELPKIERYPGGQTTPTPKQIDFKRGELLGSVSGGLGLRKFLEGLGHTFIVTSDKEGPNSAFERALPDAEVVISQPFWPAYLTAERIAKAKKLKLAITAGIGSDHADLRAALKHGVTVAEVTYSNSKMAVVRLFRERGRERRKPPEVELSRGPGGSNNLPGMAAFCGMPTANQGRKKNVPTGCLGGGRTRSPITPSLCDISKT